MYIRRIFLHNEISVRQNIPAAKVPTAKFVMVNFPYVEIFLQRTFLTTKFPTAKFLTPKLPTVIFPVTTTTVFVSVGTVSCLKLVMLFLYEYVALQLEFLTVN